LINDRIKVIVGVSVVNSDGDCGGDGSIDQIIIGSGDSDGLCRIPVDRCEGYGCWDGCFTGVIGCDGEDNV